jgi:undecaprenyl-diphosphatase
MTEFLAVSSSGHTILLRDIFGLTLPPGVEGAARCGMIAAIIAVFYRELWAMLRSVWSVIQHPWGLTAALKTDEHLRMVLHLIVGSVPIGLVGVLFGGSLLEIGDDTKMVATFVIISGLLLFLTRMIRRRRHKSLSVGISFLVGCAQALAIVPGLARMATAISMAVYAGVAPVAAARYATLLAIPAFVGLLTIGSPGMSSWWPIQAPLGTLAIAFVAAMTAGWLGIRSLLWSMASGAVRYLALYCLLIGLLGIIIV